MNLLIAGDFYVSDDFQGKDLFDTPVESLFAGVDYRIINLEAPITLRARKNTILKTGPHLCAKKETVLPPLEKLHVDMATLANNHIMDYGRPGLLDTLGSLKSANIQTVGAGLNLQEARKPFILENDGDRIAIMNFAENEWASATMDRAGANPLDLIENIRQIREAKKSSGYVIVIIHGGHEYYEFPSPRMVRQYRLYAENGASAIVGHHSHCISGYEVFQGVPIFYGLGNFIFTDPSDFEVWYTGLILNLQISRNKDISWELIPVIQSKSQYFLTRPEGGKDEIVRNAINKYSATITDEALLAQEWKRLLSTRKRQYLDLFSPLNIIQNRYVRAALSRIGVAHLFIRKKHLARILNNIRCESHAEAVRDIIELFLE
jgi:hypothetical protein